MSTLPTIVMLAVCLFGIWYVGRNLVLDVADQHELAVSRWVSYVVVVSNVMAIIICVLLLCDVL